MLITCFTLPHMIMHNHSPLTNASSNKSNSSLSVNSGIDWLLTYKPLLIILAVCLIASAFMPLYWMPAFMGLFLLMLALLKFLDLEGFAKGYSTYDLIAQKWHFWGYIYPFVELFLGLMFLSGLHLLIPSILTLLTMSVAGVGVFEAVRQNRDIKCACLGTLIKLPLTSVSIVENAGMAVMSLVLIAEILL